jgi:hypothetical protein
MLYKFVRILKFELIFWEYLKELKLKKEITGCWVKYGPWSRPLWSGGLLHRPDQKAIAAHPTVGFSLDGPN